METKKTYYHLPTDGYGQPNGNVFEIDLTQEDYLKRKTQGQYIFDNYLAALYRAQD